MGGQRGGIGWGVNFVHQGDSVYATWYTYDLDGAPLWLSALAVRQGTSNVYTGPIYRTSGPRFDNYNAAEIQTEAVGAATITFADGNNVNFGYTTNGTGDLPVVTQAKQLTRFSFAANGGVVCRAPLPTCGTGPPLALLPPEPSAAPGDDFVDPVTGHRIVRLSRLENGGASFYFTQNEFNCRGNKLVFDNAHGSPGRWLYSIDLETFDIQPLASAENYLLFEVVAPKRNEVLHLGSDWTLRATNLDTH